MNVDVLIEHYRAIWVEAGYDQTTIDALEREVRRLLREIRRG